MTGRALHSGWRPVPLLLGGLGVASSTVGALVNPGLFHQAWLFAALYWLGLSLGCLALLMTHRLTGGEWGEYLAPLLRAGAAALPLGLLALVPLLFGLDGLYPWTAPAVTLTEAVQYKLAYLDAGFFRARTVLYALLWLLFAALMRVWQAPSQPGVPPPSVAAAGLLLHTLAISFFAIDWIMSLDPRFYSAVFGALVGVGQILAAMALTLLVAARMTPWRTAPRGRHARHDLGNLLMAFVLLWVYLAFSQLLIIWSADLPQEIRFYHQRSGQGWPLVALLMALFHFALPFIALMSRRVKDSAGALSLIAATLLAAHGLWLWWLLMPSLGRAAGEFGWREPAAFLGIGGLWLALFLWRLDDARSPSVALDTPVEMRA